MDAGGWCAGAAEPADSQVCVGAAEEGRLSVADEIRLRLNEDGSVVLPASVREALRIATGDEVLLMQEESGFLLTTRRLRIEEAQRRLRRYVKPGVSMVTN
ncbi:MAG: AbrB/MazE/SpoVT family DNA-binding domain-containing protein [Acidobacteriota bacterium]